MTMERQNINYIGRIFFAYKNSVMMSYPIYGILTLNLILSNLNLYKFSSIGWISISKCE
jgi:hypothetical protein